MAYYDAKEKLKELLDGYSAETEKIEQLYKTALSNAQKGYESALAESKVESERKRNRAYADNALEERSTMNMLASRGLGSSGEAVQAKLNSNLLLEGRLAEIDRDEAEAARELKQSLSDTELSLAKEKQTAKNNIFKEQSELYTELARLESDSTDNLNTGNGNGSTTNGSQGNPNGNGIGESITDIPEFTPEASPKELAKLMVGAATDDGYIRSDYDEYLINRYMLELYENYQLDDSYMKELVFMLKAYGYPESDISEMRVQVISREAKTDYDESYKKLYDSAILSGKHALSASVYAAQTAENELLDMIYSRTASDSEFREVCKNAGVTDAVAEAYLANHKRPEAANVGKGGSGLVTQQTK